MRAVIQRVLESSVTVDGKIVGQSGKGYMILLGVVKGAAVAVIFCLIISLIVSFTKDGFLKGINDIENKKYTVFIDLKPALSEGELDDRILRDFAEVINKDFANSLGKLLPTKLIPIIVELSQIDPHKKVNEITKEERLNLVKLIKGLTVTVASTRSFNEAIITKGGVSVKEMENYPVWDTECDVNDDDCIYCGRCIGILEIIRGTRI